MNPTTGLITEAWNYYKRFWTHFVSIAAVIYAITTVVSAIFIAIGGLGALFLLSIVSVIAGSLLQGALVKAVEDVRDGRADLTVGETFRAATPYIGVVLGAAILQGLGIGIGLILLIIPGLVLLTWWCVVIPVVVVERSGVIAAFSRSRALVRGNDFNVFGVIALVVLIEIAASIVIGLLLSTLPADAQRLASNFISGVIVGPIYAIVLALLYYRLRDNASGAAGPPPPPLPGT